MQEIPNIWRNALMGFFIRNPPMFFAIKSSLTKAWKCQEGVVFYSYLDSKFFIFKFKSFFKSQKALEEGLWFINGHPLFLRRWNENLNFSKEELHSIPIWIRFLNLRMSCRSVNSLSKIARCIGISIPICMDQYLLRPGKKLHLHGFW